MKLFVHLEARNKIRLTAKYIYKTFGDKSRKKFLAEINEIGKLLCSQPNLGIVEPLLTDSPIMYRSILVQRINKIIYWINNDVIEIVDLWDCRREPIAQAKGVR